MLHYHCEESGKGGRYNNFSRHAHNCEHCGLETRDEQKQRLTAQREKKEEVVKEQATQKPYADWAKKEGKMEHETGVSSQTFDLVLRSTDDELSVLHGRKVRQAGHVLLSAVNLLLLLLVFLRQNPTQWKLADLFSIAEGGAFKLVKKVLKIVTPILKLYVKPPPRIRHIVQSGLLKGAAFFTDTTDTKIPRPGRGQNPDRKLYYYGKLRNFSLKVQLSVGLDGTIWECSKAYPGSKSDRGIFEESVLPNLIERTGVLGVGDSHYVKCEGMLGKKVGSKQSVVYGGYNQDIENTRAVVENVIHRVKAFHSIAGEWTHDRHDLAFFSDCVMSVCGLVNLEIKHGHPIRKNICTLLPRVQEQRRKARESKKEKDREAKAGAEESEEESEEHSEEEPEEEFHEVDKIVSHRKGKALGKDVIFYRVKFLDGDVRDCTADYVTEEALDEYLKHHPI